MNKACFLYFYQKCRLHQCNRKTEGFYLMFPRELSEKLVSISFNISGFIGNADYNFLEAKITYSNDLFVA